MGLRIQRMIRELRADPSTQFFEPILCGDAFAPPSDFREHLRGEALAAHAWAAAVSLGGPARAPATTVAMPADAPVASALEIEEELPLSR